MYNFLVNATKNRLILELKEVFSKHPIYKDIEIYNRYPYNERVQEGIILKNASANRVPLAADNFQGSVSSHVTFANHSNFPGKSLEWVKEDESHLTNWIYKDDYSSQFITSCKEINMSVYMLKGKRNLNYANSIKDVHVYINNSRVIPLYVDGENKVILLSEAPPINSKVEISYWSRNLAPPGIYQIEIVDGDPKIHKYSFMVDVLLDREDTLIEKATGDEITVRLNHYPIYPGSLILKENDILMDKTSDYDFDEVQGIITFNVKPLRNSTIKAYYRTRGLSTGPFEIPYFNRAINNAIPGVVLAFGRGVSVTDKHFVVINKEREITALEYSGKWDMSISFDVYAKDSFKVEEIIDIATSHLHVFKKSQLDAEGIVLVDVSFGGESEEVFDEATGDLYYMGSIDYMFLTEWIMHQPLLKTIDGFLLDATVLAQPEPFIPNLTKNFETII